MTLGKHPAGGGLPKTHLFGTLRLILAVMVIVQHAHWVAPVGLSSWLQLPRTGTIAVLAFFVLSGFIITEAAERFYERRAVSFFANRMLRIFPPLMLAMALSIGVHYSLGDQLRIMDDYHGAEPFSSRNLLQNLWFCIPVFGDILPRPEYPFIPYIWAIRTEFLFYGVVFCALLAASRLGPFRRVLSCLGVSFALLYVAWRLGALHVETLRFIPYFALGCAMYFARMRSIVPSATVLILTVVCLADVGDVAPGGSAHLYAP